MHALFAFCVFCAYYVESYIIPKMVMGGFLKKIPMGGSNQPVPIEFTQGPSTFTVDAKVGDQLATVAEQAGVEIKYKCKKGECGTCQVQINGKWVKTCQTTVPALGSGESVMKITVKEIPKGPEKKSATFFSPQSFVDGFTNNAIGMVGFVQVGMKADDEFNDRMKREADLAAKVEAKKRAKMEAEAAAKKK